MAAIDGGCREMEDSKWYIIASGSFMLTLFLLIIVPISFSYLEYYQYGFERQKSTGKVDKSTIYGSGRYGLGPDFEFKSFQADAHFETLYNVAVFTSDKLEVSITAHYEYFVRRHQLVLLHDAYDVYYEDIIKPAAIDALKGSATTFSTREFFSDRANIESTLYEAVKLRLGGTCCAEDCSAFTGACWSGCTLYQSCNSTQMGYFVDVKYFQLGQIKIPKDVMERFITSLTLQEDAQKELLLQESQVIRKSTAALIENLKNEAREIQQNGTAIASVLSATAQANYTATLEHARVEGLNNLFTNLGITSMDHKSSMDYLRTLRSMNNAHITIDYQQRIVGNF